MSVQQGSQDSAPDRWFGWQRLGGARTWEAVVFANSEKEAFTELMKYPLPPLTRHRDSVVMKAGENPNKRKKSR